MTAERCPDEFIALAGQLADASGAIIRPYFRTPISVDTKADDSPVTIADREAETVMRTIIEDAYPDHGIFGEEHGFVRTEAEFAWVLDPIDGTKAFISGMPIFGTLIALMRNGKPILGIDNAERCADCDPQGFDPGDGDELHNPPGHVQDR
jgi:inositol-phosphate phosphatase/L-galactose 1-phosphate phosphatase/histidinol-phosphatase